MSINACCQGQNENGAWAYGMLPIQSWVDSFHTGYNLDGIYAYQQLTGDTQYNDNIERGFRYYIENFFEINGMPKYYNNRIYPIDIHCPAQLVVTVSRLGKYKQYASLVNKVINWTLKNMQDRKGFFYYQMKPSFSSRISYMRWSNAFMFYSLSYLILEESNHK
jgi:rhamnogalacturonyl hydrolase YesR